MQDEVNMTKPTRWSQGWYQGWCALLLCGALLLTGCATAPPSPYADIQEETTGSSAPPAVAREAIAGGTFNQFFPDSAAPFEVVPSQEKQGFAEYKLNEGGTTVAMLSINDTASNPEAATKFLDSTEQIGGYPAVDIGSQQTALLVSDRFQVKVQSRDDSFDREDRVAWLEQFDLTGLSRLE